MNKSLKFYLSALMMLLLTIALITACSKSDDGGQAADPPPASTEGQGEETGGDDESEVYESNGLPKNEEVTLKLGFFDAGYGRDHIDYAMQTFMEEFPNVKFDPTYSPTISQVISTKIAAKDDDDMFDIFNGTIEGGALALVENGLLEPQEDLWDHFVYDAPDKTVKEALMEGSYETFGRINGVSYTLPSHGTGAGLYYEKALFEENGWNTQPKTWSEFVELLEEIKQTGIIPLTYPGLHPNYIDNAFGRWKLFEIAEHNGNLEEFEKRYRNYEHPYYTSPEMIYLWEKIYELGQKGYFPKGVAGIDHVQSQMQIIQRKAALVSSGSWVENEMKDNVDEDFEWGYMIVPMTEDPNQRLWTRLSSSGGYYIWANKPELNKKWAKEFSVWVLNLDVQEANAKHAGQMPLRGDFAEDPARLDVLQPLIRSMLESHDINNVRGESAYRDVSYSAPETSQAVKVRDEAVTRITEGTLNPIEMLEEADALLKTAIEKQGN